MIIHGKQPHVARKPLPLQPPNQMPYSAVGVQFPGVDNQDNIVYLNCPALNCVDGGAFSFSFWVQNFIFNNIIFMVDPLNVANPTFTMAGSILSPFLQMNLQLSNSSNGSFTMNWSSSPVSDQNWHHYLGSFYTNDLPGNKAGALYIDDILQTPTSQTDNGTGAFIAPVFGRKFYMGGDGSFATAKVMTLSDVWICVGTNLLLSLNQQTGSYLPIIPTWKRRIFTGVSNDGSFMFPRGPLNFGADTPEAPIILTGGARTFGSNFGYGGTFRLQGSNSSVTDVPGPGKIPI